MALVTEYGRITLSKQRLTDRKKAAIVDAAISEFQEQGFAGTSMDKIAARAEVSKRTVYNHFASKDELFAEIMQQLWTRAMGAEQICYDPVRSLREQLAELLCNKLAVMTQADFLSLSRVAIAEMIHRPEWANQMLTELSQNESSLIGWLKQAVADGRLKPMDPEFAAGQLHALIKGMAFWPQISLGQPSPTAEQQQQLIDATIDMFLTYYQQPV